MSKQPAFASFQNSKLFKHLESKKEDSSLARNLDDIFKEFAGHVLPQLGQTNQLFDEYTPHDAQHIASLFRIADTLLEPILTNLNGIESFVLCSAIVGHDWGMAVSKDERDAIVRGAITDGAFARLGNDHELWTSFAQQQGLPLDKEGFLPPDKQLPDDLWRDYVRGTHAERSRARALHYFKDDLYHLGPLVGAVCAGHAYDISEIKSLETHKSVYGDVANERALATYMRFIDLLDIAENRTPQALRRFVNPRNEFSATEWKKHAALNPVTISNDRQYRRTLRIHGETTSPTVYASLVDLERYIKSQAEENVLVLSKLDDKYDIGALHIEWKVEAKGFVPIDIRFEFDRNRIFEIVSSEIYDGDPYVFLRELLQNAVDATTVRLKRYELEGKAHNTDIKISVTHQDNGDATIVFTDQGSGMDADTVKHFLAVVGKSYYQSKEFNKLGLAMSPISRFGIGLLSCFEVADALVIETNTDRSFGNARGLRIEIPDVNKQFVVTEKSNLPEGTSVTLQVLGQKWRKNNFALVKKLRVTEYLKAIAGFVPYAIRVIEDGFETVVMSATTTPEEIEKRKKQLLQGTVWQMPLTYDLDEMVAEEDRVAINAAFKVQTVTVDTAADDVLLQGAITYLVPQLPTIGIPIVGTQRWHHHTSQSAGAIIHIALENQRHHIFVRWKQGNPSSRKFIAPSASFKLNQRTYLRGVLVPDLDVSEKVGIRTAAPPPRLIINLEPVTNRLTPTTSRRGLREPLGDIKEGLGQVYREDLTQLYGQQLHEAKPAERLKLLGFLTAYLGNVDTLEHVLPVEEWPIVSVDNGGNKAVTLFKDLPETLTIVPKYFMQINQLKDEAWDMTNWLKRPAPQFDQFSPAKDLLYVRDFGYEYDDGSPIEWNMLDDLMYYALHRRFHWSGVSVAVLEDTRCIFELWKKGERKKEEEAYSDYYEWSIMFRPFDAVTKEVACLLPIERSQIQDDVLRAMIFNSEHEAVKVLQRVLATYGRERDNLSEAAYERLRNVFLTNPFIGTFYHEKRRDPNLESRLAAWVLQFCQAVADEGLIALSSEERQQLNQSLVVMTCRE